MACVAMTSDRYATLIGSNAHGTATAGSLVHSGPSQYSSVEYRGGALDHCHRNRSRRTWGNRVNVYDRIGRVRHEMFAGAEPGRSHGLEVGSCLGLFPLRVARSFWHRAAFDRAATPLAGHGACQLNGVPVVLASYDQRTGNWSTNPRCYRLPAYLKEVNASALWAGDA